MTLLRSTTAMLRPDSGTRIAVFTIPTFQTTTQQHVVLKFTLVSRLDTSLVIDIEHQNGLSSDIRSLVLQRTLSPYEQYTLELTPLFYQPGDQLLVSTPLNVISTGGYSTDNIYEYANLDWITQDGLTFSEIQGFAPLDILVTSAIEG